MSSRCSLVPFALALLVSHAPVNAHVLVVAPTPGPGVDATTITAAVAAAADGDVVLVRVGAYSEHVVIDGKSLTLAADAGANVEIQGGLEIAHLLASQAVIAQGLELGAGAGQVAPPRYVSGVLVHACAGPVHVDGCSARGRAGSVDASAPLQCQAEPGQPATQLTRVSAIVFAGCHSTAASAAITRSARTSRTAARRAAARSARRDRTSRCTNRC